MQNSNKTYIDYYDNIQKYNKKIRKALIYTSITALINILIIIFYYYLKNNLSPEEITNIYTEKLFYYINIPFKFISRITPFSVTEFLLYTVILLFVISLIRLFFITGKMIYLYLKLRKEKKYPEIHYIFYPGAAFTFNIFSFFCIMISIFILFGGINYMGISYDKKAELKIQASTVADLQKLCLYLGNNASIARSKLSLNLDKSINENSPEYNPFELAEAAQEAYNNIPEEYNITKKAFPNVKFALGSSLMSNIHITGIYPYVFPEAIVNINTPIMSLPHTICHEMAHQRGFAREDEANFIAYIASISSDNPLMVYSGYYTAFTYSMNMLYEYDRESWEFIYNNMNKNIRLDIQKETTYWKQFESISSETSSNINNAYLSAMDIEDGVKSYGRMVDLLLADAKKYGKI